MRGRAREVVAATVAGAVLASWAARRTGASGGGRLVAAGIGAANGAIGGARAVYDWAEPNGAAAFALDSTWSLPNTAAGMVVHALSAARGDPGYRPELSERRNRHVYARGFALRRSFAFTQGNVITNAAADADLDDVDAPRTIRRRLLVDRHEDLHVWQARWFGPFYPLLYVGWMPIGAVRGWLRWRRRRDHSWWQYVEVGAYYENPFERWAYRADDHWPPATVNRLRSSDVT